MGDIVGKEINHLIRYATSILDRLYVSLCLLLGEINAGILGFNLIAA